MAVRKEIAFFLVFAGLLGWRAAGLFGSGEVAPRRSRSAGTGDGGVDYAPGAVPRADLALAGARADDLSRDLFSPPRDTAPLPALPLELPPLEELEVLAPPTAWGPGPRAMGKVLRRPQQTTDVPDLFELAEETLDLPDDPAEGEFAAAPLDARDLDAASRLEQIEAFKQQYDWLLVPDLHFGFIKNGDRFSLLGNNEPIQFLEVDTSTGAPRFPGQAPIPYERARISDFGFADTPANSIELGARALSDPLRPAEFDAALELAERCISLRNETPRALELAEELFLRAEAVGTDRVRARLGLARCYELAFRFDDALAVYRGLTEGEGQTQPGPWARLADLYARFRLSERAEETYRTALAKSRADWDARLRYGRYLASLGRDDEAYAVLSEALQREPTEPGLRDARVSIRSELAQVCVRQGKLAEAKDLFQRTRSADPDFDLGLAGLISLAAVADEAAPTEGGDASPDASFDLLFARGLRATYQGAWQAARRDLELAEALDPFRAALPRRTLSWLAEVTGHPEEAMAFVERALEGAPTDAWSLVQRGRLLAEQDDLEGALQSFQQALDHELDFPDVLVAMGRISQRLGRHEAAERYYERALSLDPKRPVVHSLRGFNHLQLGAVGPAAGDFETALAQRPELASAANGLAWTEYARGNSGEALTLFADLADRRRNEPEGDPHRAYAEAQKDRILDHESKEVWTDRFDRVGRIANDWKYDEGDGAEVRLADGGVRIQGQLTRETRTRVMRELPADRFLALEATVSIAPESSAVSAGIFVARETGTRTSDTRVNAAVELVRNGSDGQVQARIVKRGEDEPELRDLASAVWPLGEPVRLRVERRGESSNDTTVTLWLNDVPVLEDLPVQALGRSNQALTFGVFAEGKSGRTVNLLVDDVRVVRRRQ